jgi:hypothetical protein
MGKTVTARDAENAAVSTLFELCDELLLTLVVIGPQKFVERTIARGADIAHAKQAALAYAANRASRNLPVDSTFMSATRALFSVYRGVLDEQTTSTGIAARMQTLLAYFDRLCRERGFEARSAAAATRVWG